MGALFIIITLFTLIVGCKVDAQKKNSADNKVVSRAFLSRH